jgi:hypothetical protein
VGDLGCEVKREPVHRTDPRIPIMTDREFIYAFEIRAVPPEDFHHADHVRLAFAYLCEFPPLEALQKFSNALKRFAEACGKADRYHETITCAYFFLIAERKAREEVMSWDEFASRNPDLLTWKDGILGRYYEQETLKTDLARRVFLLPDKYSRQPDFG